jgi:protein-disulfide isomerase
MHRCAGLAPKEVALRISRWWLGSLIAIVLLGIWLVLTRETPVSPAVLSSHSDEVLRDVDSPVGGNPDGDVTLVEFYDYNCPYCRQMSGVIAEAEAADPQLRTVYKEWPILGSVFPAKAALAANRQGKFMVFHRALYQLRGEVNEGKTLATALSLGLDLDRLKTDLQAPAIDAVLKRNLALARLLKIDGTPGFVIGDQILMGPTELEKLQTIIRDVRRSKRFSQKSQEEL